MAEANIGFVCACAWGDYVLEMLDADGEVLRSVPFAASVGVDDTGPEQTAVGLLVLGIR